MHLPCHHHCFDIILVEVKVSTSIIVRDVLHHTTEDLLIVGQQALLHIITKQVAEDTTEILVARIREERARVGEHTHESAQQSQYRECVHLTDHTIHLIIEPPA